MKPEPRRRYRRKSHIPDMHPTEAEWHTYLGTPRPRTRGDCATVPRPCPYVGCHHNLWSEVCIRGRYVPPWEMPPDCSCALDVADMGGLTMEEVGTVLGVTRERVRQIELKLRRQLRRWALRMR